MSHPIITSPDRACNVSHRLNGHPSSTPSGFRPDLVRWRQLVTPAWLAGLIAQAPVSATPAADWRLFEIGFGAADAFLCGHIPGACYIDTLEMESEPLWNKVSDQALLQLLLRQGIRHDTTVVLYGRNNLAAARAAHLMLYAGVADVRLLDGGFHGWTAMSLPLMPGAGRAYPVADDFGVHCPAHPEYLTHAHQVRGLLRDADVAVVSMRTWKEFIGHTSGYSYIDAKGEIAGACWGRSGTDDDVNSMSEFHERDGTMKSAADIGGLWRTRGIHRKRRTIFYCGTGWRASLAFFYAWLMHWDFVSVYDGGWCEWSRDPGNPIICRVGSGLPCDVI